MKIVAIGGEPGTGKTSLVRKFIENYNFQKKYSEYKLVPYFQDNNIFLLGKYDEGKIFAGTDTMSMAVQPAAKEFLKTIPENSVVIFEGDRLFNSSFLEYCQSICDDVTMVILEAPPEELKDRYGERGSNQNETWLAGRKKKLANIMSNLMFFDIIVRFENKNHDDQNNIVKYLVEKIAE